MSMVKPNYTFTFCNDDNKEIGRLDFNGPTMVFTGEVEESSKQFLDLVMCYFERRLEDERKDTAKDIVNILKGRELDTIDWAIIYIKDRYGL